MYFPPEAQPESATRYLAGFWVAVSATPGHPKPSQSRRIKNEERHTSFPRCKQYVAARLHQAQADVLELGAGNGTRSTRHEVGAAGRLGERHDVADGVGTGEQLSLIHI